MSICPPDHKHAETLTCVTAHRCTCEDCRAAKRDYNFWRIHMIAAGRADVIDRLVPATGTRRRIQALMTVGWSQSALSHHIGHRQTRISEWLRADTVRGSTHHRVAAVYEELSDTIPDTTTTRQRMSVNRTRALAARNGWARPIDWDDIDNDPAPPTAEPARDAVDDVAVLLATEGQQVCLNPSERRQVVGRLHARGYNDTDIARFAMCTTRQVLRIRAELGLLANVDAAGDRIAS